MEEITLIIGTQIVRKTITVSLNATIRELIKEHISDDVYQETFKGYYSTHYRWEINGKRIVDYGNCNSGVLEYETVWDKPLGSFLDSKDRERGKAYMLGIISLGVA